MTGCIGGKRYLRPQVLDRCQDCWKGKNVLGSSWTWCYKGEQSRDGVVFSINPSAGRFSQRYLLEIRIDGLTQAKIALLHHVGGGNLGDDATLTQRRFAECRNSRVLNEH